MVPVATGSPCESPVIPTAPGQARGAVTKERVLQSYPPKYLPSSPGTACRAWRWGLPKTPRPATGQSCSVPGEPHSLVQRHGSGAAGRGAPGRHGLLSGSRHLSENRLHATAPCSAPAGAGAASSAAGGAQHRGAPGATGQQPPAVPRLLPPAPNFCMVNPQQLTIRLVPE